MPKKKKRTYNKFKTVRLIIMWLRERGIDIRDNPSNKELKKLVIGLDGLPQRLAVRTKEWNTLNKFLDDMDRFFNNKKFPVSRNNVKAFQRGSFYESREWQELRFLALTKYGRRCMCCGATPDNDGIVLHVDHVKPRSKYPELELDLNNLQILCKSCNLGKSNKSNADFRSGEHLKTIH